MRRPLPADPPRPRTGTGLRLAVEDIERLAATLDTLDAATEAAHDDS